MRSAAAKKRPPSRPALQDAASVRTRAAPARRRAPACDDRHVRQVGPDAELHATAALQKLVADRRVQELSRPGGDERPGEHRGERGDKHKHVARAPPSDAQELQSQQRGEELGQGGGCHEQPASGRTLRCRDDRPYAEGGDQRVVGFRHQGEVGKRVEQVGERKRSSERAAAEPPAQGEQSGERQRVEARRRQQRRYLCRRRREERPRTGCTRSRRTGRRSPGGRPGGPRALPRHRPVEVQSVQNAPGAERARLPDIRRCCFPRDFRPERAAVSVSPGPPIGSWWPGAARAAATSRGTLPPGGRTTSRGSRPPATGRLRADRR